MRKHIKAAVLLLALTLPLVFWGISRNNKQTFSQSRGNYFFVQTRDHSDITKIGLRFPDGQTVSIEKKDGLWRIKEADDYFAAFSKINTLVGLIRNTAIYRADLLKGEEAAKLAADGIRFTSTDSAGQIVEQAVIAPRKENNKYHYAIRGDEPFIYQLSGDFSLSPYALDWVQMPILALNYQQIKRVKSDNFEVYRRFAADTFKSVENGEETPHIRGFLNNFWYLGAEDIKHAVHFNPDGYEKIKNYEISLFGGAVYQIGIYQHNDDYWMSVRLEREKLISAESAQKIKENSILYEGWFFKLNRDKGKVISGFVL